MNDMKISLDINSSSAERVANSYSNKVILTVFGVLAVVVIAGLFLFSSLTSAYNEACGDMMLNECIASGVSDGLDSALGSSAAAGVIGAGLSLFSRGIPGLLSFFVSKSVS